MHSILMLVHGKTGPLPEFRPHDDIQAVLTWLAGTELPPSAAWLLMFINGAVIWGFLFGQSYNLLPGRHPWQKGLVFGLFAWTVMGLLFFPFVDRGIFAIRLGLGIAPAVLLLLMLSAYAVTMSFVYDLLNRYSA